MNQRNALRRSNSRLQSLILLQHQVYIQLLLFGNARLRSVLRFLRQAAQHGEQERLRVRADRFAQCGLAERLQIAQEVGVEEIALTDVRFRLFLLLLFLFIDLRAAQSQQESLQHQRIHRCVRRHHAVQIIQRPATPRSRHVALLVRFIRRFLLFFFFSLHADRVFVYLQDRFQRVPFAWGCKKRR